MTKERGNSLFNSKNMDILNNPQTIDRTSVPEMEQVEKEKLEYKLLGHCLLTPGLSLFSFSVESGEIKRIKVESKEVVSVEETNKRDKTYVSVTKKKVTVDNRVIYFEALNIKNAVRKVTRLLEGKTKKLFNLTLINSNDNKPKKSDSSL